MIKKKIVLANFIVIITIITLIFTVMPTYFDETIDKSVPKINYEKQKEIITIKDTNSNISSQLYDSVKNYNGKTSGILPAFAIVRCKWKLDKDGGARTIHFWVRGRGYHEIRWQIWDDHDGDGKWDIWGPDPPRSEEWFGLILPIRHYSSYSSWGGYEGKPNAMVKYWIDGKSFTKTFYSK